VAVSAPAGAPGGGATGSVYDGAGGGGGTQTIVININAPPGGYVEAGRTYQYAINRARSEDGQGRVF